MRMKTYAVLRIIFIIVLWLIALSYFGYIVYGYFKGYNGTGLMASSVGYFVFSTALSITVYRLTYVIAAGKKRYEEGKRKFGTASYFYDIPALVIAMGRNSYARHHQGAVIAFAVFSDTEKYLYFQIEKIKSFYGIIVQYLEALLNVRELKGRLNAGYDNRIFYLYYDYEDEADLKGMLSKIEKDLYVLYERSEVRVNMHPSFGVYVLGRKDDDMRGSLEKASLALSSAVSSYQVAVFYDERLSAENVHNDMLEKEIRRGIEKQEFKVYYQAKFDLATDRFVGAEALIRWQHPEKGLFNPGAFIGECEKSGLIHVLDFYVFDQVCKDLGDWKKRGRRMLPVSVNFSSSDFYRPDFFESVVKTIDSNGIPPNFLEVEITESSTVSNYFYVMSVLKRLKELNIRILMDDFGTGFSSLGNLKKYPISALKIDKSFVDEMQEDIKSKEIVATIIDLSKSLGLQSIAEGVQTERQVEMLRELKCNIIQGYYYCKPMPKKDFEIFLSTNQFEKKGMLL